MKDDKRGGIASRIREARLIAGLSQGQVANLLGLQRPSVSEIEAGNRAVSAEELSKLSKILDVSSSWLLGEGREGENNQDARVHLAARELAKLKPIDLDRLLRVLTSMREQEPDS